MKIFELINVIFTITDIIHLNNINIILIIVKY